jgi:N-acetylmuramoyl-L-alanine amidase
VSDDPADIMARTLYGEARGEGREGIEAVAAVIMNRVRNPRWWGIDVVSVCQKPWQFSCWNDGDPNRAKLLAVTAADPQFQECQAIAHDALNGVLVDPTSNADSYFDTIIQPPSWAIGRLPVYLIGDLRFYRLELPLLDNQGQPTS